MNKLDSLTVEIVKLSLDELYALNKIVVGEINFQRRRTASLALSTFRKGDMVKFKSSKHNTWISGEIERINQTSVTLKNCSDGKIWKVGVSHLVKVVTGNLTREQGLDKILEDAKDIEQEIRARSREAIIEAEFNEEVGGGK